MVLLDECPWCKGSGKNFAAAGPCPACLGTGKRQPRTDRQLKEAARKLMDDKKRWEDER